MGLCAAVDDFQAELDRWVTTHSGTEKKVSADDFKSWIGTVLEQGFDGGVSLDLRGCCFEGGSFELGPTRCCQGLKLSNGTLDISNGLRVKGFEGLELEDMVLKGHDVGIAMTDSCVSLRNCRISSGCTLAIASQSKVDFSHCQLCESSSGDGLIVLGSKAAATAQSCDFENNTGSGVRVLRGARAELKDCTVGNSKDSAGLVVTGAGCRAVVTSCEFLANHCNGIAVADGACVEVSDSVIQDTAGFHGLAASDLGTKVQIVECDFLNNHECGVYVTAGASVSMNQCIAKGSKKFSGISVEGQNTKLDATSCEFLENMHCGCAIGGGAQVNLNGCVGKGSKELYGIAVTGEATRAELKGCHFSHNYLCGVYVYGGARVSLERCVSKAGKEGSDGCSSVGFGKGSLMLCGSKLMDQGGNFGQWHRNGVSMIGGGTATLTECVSRTSGPNGVTVIGGSSSVLARKCDFGGESRDQRLDQAFASMLQINP
ncbi:hypothetical protein BSKO_13242 [Bryopsis sp. KO-2023]|nr:hypothetical protein BSKO_13242 [Bryopsis sp. KO-2023]